MSIFDLSTLFAYVKSVDKNRVGITPLVFISVMTATPDVSFISQNHDYVQHVQQGSRQPMCLSVRDVCLHERNVF